MKITKIQNAALETAVNLSDCIKREELLTLIYGILNIEVTDETSITAIPIIPDNGNDGLQINIPNIPNIPGVQIFPGEIIHPDPCPFPPQVWYNQETEPIQPTAQELRYATEVARTGDKNGIVCTTNTADVQYNGDFRDMQTSFNDK